MARRTERAERGALRLDPRLMIGIVLVGASTAGVWALVAGLDDSVDVYAVRETATPGMRLHADDLALESARLGGSVDHYLTPSELPEQGLVVTRTVGAGELVPDSAVDTVDRAGLATVVVPGRGPLPSGLTVGSAVDVWAAAEIEQGGYEPPAVLVGDAQVAAVQEPEGMVASGSGIAVELLIPRERVAALLQALASGDAIDLVPARAGSN